MAMFNSYVSLPEGISISAESFAILHESAETFRELPGFSRAPATLAAQAGVNLGEPWMIHGLIHLLLEKWWLML